MSIIARTLSVNAADFGVWCSALNTSNALQSVRYNRSIGSDASVPVYWVFANSAKGRPYHQDTIQQKHIRRAGMEAGLGDGIGWHTFRHSYRSWLDDTGAPLTVQKELMRHASIQTTMKIYGKAMTDSKRQPTAKSWNWC